MVGFGAKRRKGAISTGTAGESSILRSAARSSISLSPLVVGATDLAGTNGEESIDGHAKWYRDTQLMAETPWSGCYESWTESGV